MKMCDNIFSPHVVILGRGHFLYNNIDVKQYVRTSTTDAVGSSLEVYEKTACWHLRIIHT
jgi:hypothetical protein